MTEDKKFRFFPLNLTLIMFLMFLIGCFVYWFITNLNIGIWGDYFFLAYGVFVLLLFLYGFFDWYLDIIYIEGSNLVIIEWQGLLKKSVSTIELDRVDTIKVKKPLLGVIFKYGDIEIVTTSHDTTIDLMHMYKPEKFKKIVLTEVHKHKRLYVQD